MSNPLNNLQGFIQQRQQISADASVVVPTDIPLVDTAMPLSDYQVEAVKFTLENRRVLIADEMGLGKTPQRSECRSLANSFRRATITAIEHRA